MHRHCHDNDLWLLIALMIVLDQDKATQPPKPSDGQGCAQGCGSCLGSLVMLALLIGGIIWITHRTQHPDPTAIARATTDAVYSYTYAEPPTPAVPTIDVAPRAIPPDSAPRAELIALPAEQLTPVRVLRATLVRLPVRRGILVKRPVR